MVVIVAALALAAPTNPTWPDTKPNHWAYEGLNLAEKVGLLAGYPQSLPRPSHPMTRYELSVAYNSTGTSLKRIDDSLKKDFQTLAKAKPGSQEAKDALSEAKAIQKSKIGSCIPFMRRAAKEFAPEFKTLGADPTLLLKEATVFELLSIEDPPKPAE